MSSKRMASNLLLFAIFADILIRVLAADFWGAWALFVGAVCAYVAAIYRSKV